MDQRSISRAQAPRSTISRSLEGLTLIDRMNAQDVSQNQIYITIKALIDLGLIEETATKRGNVRNVYTRLTPKGRQVAQLALKMKQALI